MKLWAASLWYGMRGNSSYFATGPKFEFRSFLNRSGSDRTQCIGEQEQEVLTLLLLSRGR